MRKTAVRAAQIPAATALTLKIRILQVPTARILMIRILQVPTARIPIPPPLTAVLLVLTLRQAPIVLTLIPAVQIPLLQTLLKTAEIPTAWTLTVPVRIPTVWILTVPVLQTNKYRAITLNCFENLIPSGF